MLKLGLEWGEGYVDSCGGELNCTKTSQTPKRKRSRCWNCKKPSQTPTMHRHPTLPYLVTAITSPTMQKVPLLEITRVVRKMRLPI